MTYLEIHDRTGQRRVPAGDIFTLGRSVQNHVVLHGATVSRSHARIVFQGNRAVLEDLGSTYGTSVNGQYIQEWYALHDGDQIQLGDTLVIFHEGRAGNGHDMVTPPQGLVAIPPNMVRCPHCGTLNLKNNTICYNCGNGLWHTMPPPSQPAAAMSLRAGPSARAVTGRLEPARRAGVPGWLLTLLVALSILLLSLLSMLVGLLIANGAFASVLS